MSNLEMEILNLVHLEGQIRSFQYGIQRGDPDPWRPVNRVLRDNVDLVHKAIMELLDKCLKQRGD